MEDPLDCSVEALTVPRTWEMRQTLSDEKWETARPHLLDLMLSAEKPLLELCDHCNMEQAVIRCRDCLPKQRFCSECDVFHHQSCVLHNRDSLVEGFYTAIPPTCYALRNDDGTHTLSEQGMYQKFWNYFRFSENIVLEMYYLFLCFVFHYSTSVTSCSAQQHLQLWCCRHHCLYWARHYPGHHER